MLGYIACSIARSLARSLAAVYIPDGQKKESPDRQAGEAFPLATNRMCFGTPTHTTTPAAAAAATHTHTRARAHRASVSPLFYADVLSFLRRPRFIRPSSMQTWAAPQSRKLLKSGSKRSLTQGSCKTGFRSYVQAFCSTLKWTTGCTLRKGLWSTQ